MDLIVAICDATIILCKLEPGIKYFHQNNSSLALSWLEHYIINCPTRWCWDEYCYSWIIHVGIPTKLLVKCKNRPEIFTAGLTFIEPGLQLELELGEPGCLLRHYQDVPYTSWLFSIKSQWKCINMIALCHKEMLIVN